MRRRNGWTQGGNGGVTISPRIFLITRPGNESEHFSIIEGIIYFNVVFAYFLYKADVVVLLFKVNLYRHSAINMVAKLRIIRYVLAIYIH
jgi:hypothetical protein